MEHPAPHHEHQQADPWGTGMAEGGHDGGMYGAGGYAAGGFPAGAQVYSSPDQMYAMHDPNGYAYAPQPGYEHAGGHGEGYAMPAGDYGAPIGGGYGMAAADPHGMAAGGGQPMLDAYGMPMAGGYAAAPGADDLAMYGAAGGYAVDATGYPVDAAGNWYEAGIPGWAQPELSPLEPVPSAAAAGGQTVMGGGAAASHETTQLRWSRLVLVILGVGMLAFAITNLAKQGGEGRSTTTPAEVSGLVAGGGTPADVAAATGAGDTTVPANGGMGTGAAMGSGHSAAAHQAAEQRRAAREARQARQAARARKAAAARKQQRRAAATAAANRKAAAAAARSRQGGGAAAGNLPYTGASTWIAALLGAMALGIGVMLQLRATEIGITASLYKRGPALRPLWLAAVAGGWLADSIAEWLQPLGDRLQDLTVAAPGGDRSYAAAGRAYRR